MEFNIDYRLIFALVNGRVSSLLKRRFREEFRKADLQITAEQWDVLLAISMRDTTTQQQLCDATSFSKATITRIIAALESQGIVKRDKSRVDWRSNFIRITRQGEALRDRAQIIAVKLLKTTLDGLSRIDIITAQRSLKHVVDCLEELNRQPQETEAELHLRLRREELLRKLILHKK